MSFCELCGYDGGALSYDVEYNKCLCSACRHKLKAVFTSRRCPFCNGRDVSALYDDGGAYHFVFCADCKAIGPAGDDKADAIRKWNDARRARN